ncbi:MAG: HNH endonuclease [Chloroflexi bacterium]|nr:HNH endonuclease [Chloroflexota bacterium]
MTESIAVILIVAMVVGATAYLTYDFSEYRKRRRKEADVARHELAEMTGGTPSDSPLPDVSPLARAADSALLPEEAKSLLMNAVWYRCENPRCNYTQFLDVYNISPGANGGNNSLDNLIVLCPNCRSAVEKGGISPGEMRSWVRMRAERLKFALDWPYR